MVTVDRLVEVGLVQIPTELARKSFREVLKRKSGIDSEGEADILRAIFAKATVASENEFIDQAICPDLHAEWTAFEFQQSLLGSEVQCVAYVVLLIAGYARMGGHDDYLFYNRTNDDLWIYDHDGVFRRFA